MLNTTTVGALIGAFSRIFADQLYALHREVEFLRARLDIVELHALPEDELATELAQPREGEH